jgi:hypothetical protein
MESKKIEKKKLSFTEKMLSDSIETMLSASCDLTNILLRERRFLREYQKHITTKEMNEP